MENISTKTLLTIIAILIVGLVSIYYYKNVYNEKHVKDVQKLEKSENTQNLLFFNPTPGQIEVMKKMQKLKPGEEAIYVLENKNDPKIKEYLKKYPQDSSRIEIIFGHRVK